MAIVALLLLRSSGPLPAALRLLYWGTYALSLTVLGLSFFARHRYAALRPHLLVAARVFYNLLCPQLVWHLASQNVGRSVERGGWPSEWDGLRGLRTAGHSSVQSRGAAVWQPAAATPRRSAEAEASLLTPWFMSQPCCHTLAGFFLLWVTWTRWGSELLTRECPPG